MKGFKREKILQHVRNAIVRVKSDEMLVGDFESTLSEDADLMCIDSLSMFEIGIELENEFSRELPDFYTLNAHHVKDIVDYLDNLD